MLGAYLIGLIILLLDYGFMRGTKNEDIYLWDLVFIFVWPLYMAVLIAVYIAILGKNIGKYFINKFGANNNAR